MRIKQPPQTQPNIFDVSSRLTKQTRSCQTSFTISTELKSTFAIRHRPPRISGRTRVQRGMAKSEIVMAAEKLVESKMKGNDASHDAAHAFRVRDLALSLAREEGLSSSSDTMLIVELAALLHDIGNNALPSYFCGLFKDFMLAALLHDIGDYKYMRDPSEAKIVEDFLEKEGIEESKKISILSIIKNMGIARCFTFGGSRNAVLHDPNIKPRSDLSKEKYINKEEQTTVNHFHEKLLKLKDMMKTKAGQRRADRRHKFMVEFLEEFYEEWKGRA